MVGVRVGFIVVGWLGSGRGFAHIVDYTGLVQVRYYHGCLF